MAISERRREDEIAEMLQKIGGVDSVELKVTVSPTQREAVARLDLDLLKGKIREGYFFDTPDLALFQHGVVVRARRTQGGVDDSVVKLRPIELDELSPELRASPNLKVEMDLTRGAYVVSASLKGERPVGAVKDVVEGRLPLEKFLRKDQRAFFASRDTGGVSLSDLTVLGPAYVVVLKYVPASFGRKLTIEQWHYPGEVPLVELSTKATPADVLPVYAQSVRFVQAHGLTATGDQEPKTRKALQYFSGKR